MEHRVSTVEEVVSEAERFFCLVMGLGRVLGRRWYSELSYLLDRI